MCVYSNCWEDDLIRNINETPKKCIKNLLANVKNFCASINLTPTEESFKRGWEEAMAGETMPIEQLWADI